MRVITLLLIATLTFALDLNQTIIKENNISIYKSLLQELNQSTPDYRLQRTLLTKIIDLLKNTNSFNIDTNATTKVAFVKTFLDITSLYAQALEKTREKESIDAQIDDLKNETNEENISILTKELEIAYYYKQKVKLSNFIDKIEKNYQRWLDALLLHIDDIDFLLTKKEKKRLSSYLKKLSYINKRLKKATIELERWKILEHKKKIMRIQKDIDYLNSIKKSYIQKILAIKLTNFFHLIKQKSELAPKKSKDIISFLKKERYNPYFIEAINITSSYILNRRLGDIYAKFLQIKNEIEAFLNNNKVIGIPLYQFAEALGIFLLFLLLRKIFTLLILKTLKLFAKRTHSKLDDNLIALLEGPVKFSFLIVGLYFAFDIAGIKGENFDRLIKTLILFVVFWIFYNLVTILNESIYKFARRFGRELYREIGSFFIKTLRIFIFSIGVVSILQEWNINVSAFLASLGLGGLAFALAAKDTAANLFGGLSILADRALKIDDWIKVNGVEGTVEEIGLRTTKIRTFEKSLITIPNQIIANNPVENFSRRNIRRIKMRIGLLYATTQDQIEAILTDIKNMLQSHPGISKEATLLVNFDEFGSSELSIFIYCFTNTANWGKYLEIREDVNLKIKEIVKKNGSDFAYPSQSLYIEKLPEEE